MSVESAELEQIAHRISLRMQEVAIPDSRFHLDFSQFIPGFRDSAIAAKRISEHPIYQNAQWIFVTPDNALVPLRQMLIEDGRDIVLPSYGLHRGFILVEAATIPNEHAVFASWLDGVDHFGKAVSLADLRKRGPFDLIFTGASAIGDAGLRFGMGSRYLDVEWGVFAERALVTPQIPVIALVHDIQVVQINSRPAATNVLANYIATPSRIITCPQARRPMSLDWSIVSPDLTASPPLRELRS